jgi:DNA-binding transcriptional LysR family regulator
MRGGESAEVVLQALAPAARIRLVVTAGPAGDIVTVRLGRERHRLVLPPLRTREIVFDEPRPAVGYYGTSLYLLRLGSRYGGPTERDKRTLGSFVYVEVAEPPAKPRS